MFKIQLEFKRNKMKVVVLETGTLRVNLYLAGKD